MHFHISPSTIRNASVTVPGDKSISHRALMLGSIATGRTTIRGALAADDCLATLNTMRALGVNIERAENTEVSIQGVGLRGLGASANHLDLGNSGTGMRLMAGLLCAQNFDSVLSGDASLSERPMRRIIKPLSAMGAAIESNGGKPPLMIKGAGALRAIDYELPVASAQVKSAVLLAGLYADGTTTVTEPAVSRDHTERMLGAMGVRVTTSAGKISLQNGQTLTGCRIAVPGDLSSAAFVILAALLADDADILIHNVGVNPTRTGVLDILQRMGADLILENRRQFGLEPVADIRVRSSKLTGVSVDPASVSLAIDEFPVLFVAAAAASGQTEFSGIAELRVKESDRIAAMANGMRVLGIRVEESGDGAVVHGGQFSGGTVQSYGDHRVAMSLAVAATVARDAVIVEHVNAVSTSFPGFRDMLASIGGEIRLIQGDVQ